MANSTPSHSFISIFYAREKWHELMPVIRTLLCDHDLLKSNEVNVFLSSHQGSSIRVAFKNPGEESKLKIRKFVKAVAEYMEKNPSPTLPVQLPIKSFFADFPNNVIKYNLFNERSFAPEGLSKFQMAISQLLLTFFDDHAVDDDAIFTLIVSLNRSFLHAVCVDNESEFYLIEDLVHVISNGNNEYQIPQISDHFKPLASVDSHFNFEDTMDWLQEASLKLAQEAGNKIDAYLAILRVMKLHLLKLDNSFYTGALSCLVNSMDELDAKTKQYS